MKFKKLLGALAVSSMLAAGAAHAAPVVMDTGTFVPAGDAHVGGDGDTLTAPVSIFSLTWQATSTYTDTNGSTALDIGDRVSDSGFGTVALHNSSNNPLSPNQTEGLLSSYGLFFGYTGLTGTVNAVIPQSASILGIGALYDAGGLINMWADLTPTGLDEEFTGSNDAQLMTLTVLGSSGTIGNFTIFTKVTSVLANTFFMGGVDVGDLIALQGVTGTASFNNEGGYPGAVLPITDPLQWERTSTLNGALRFNVPEPGALALLGIGLLGLGAARRNKKVA